MMKIILVLFLTLTTQAHSSLKLAPVTGSQIEVKIPYTLGEHKITSDEIQGSVTFDRDKSLVNQGELILAVQSLRHDKKELICHLQESLSLDYAKSDFPDEHVCQDDKLPSEGKNAPVFMNIVASLIEPFKLGSVKVPVRWTIHGMTKDLPVELYSEWDAENSKLIIRGKTKFQRRDFNITVKNFLFIGVDEEIPVSFNIFLGDHK
jgi:polyisoprenoid-binding protein YceI